MPVAPPRPPPILPAILRSLRVLHQQHLRHKSLFRAPLPSPPVPPLSHSLDRYLEYAAVVAAGTGQSMARTDAAVQRFREEGRQFQNSLIEIAQNSVNWVTPIWLSEMYLKIRAPLPVNTNPAYVFPKQQFEGVEDQIKYTALLIRGMMDFKGMIDRKEIERELSTGREKTRMCMEQYDRILSTHRAPNREEDVHLRKEPSNDEHVLVMCHNQTFTIPVKVRGELLSTAVLRKLLAQVVSRASLRPSSMVLPLGAASAGDRDVAAEFWEAMKPNNEASLKAVHDAIFVVCLDLDRVEKPAETKEKELIQRGHHLLHGNGAQNSGLNRWYDATIQVVVNADGWSGFCIEHSTAEGIVIVSMAEYALNFVHQNQRRKSIAPESSPSISPTTLTWHVGPEERALLDKQIQKFQGLSDDIDLDVLLFDGFGKKAIKAMGVSPDGFAQLAMQLAHYRLHGHLVSTYESCTHRRFAQGRVDNIRANTPEALAWVTAMESPSINEETRRALFRKAAAKQAKVTVENVSGYGIDNHLCALWVMARDVNSDEMPELFREPMWTELMRFPLSTSQVTTSPTLPRFDCYLCYGAVVNDGYGCAYNIQEDHLIFAPTAFKSCAKTSAAKFKEAIRSSLHDMATLLEGGQR